MPDSGLCHGCDYAILNIIFDLISIFADASSIMTLNPIPSIISGGIQAIGIMGTTAAAAQSKNPYEYDFWYEQKYLDGLSTIPVLGIYTSTQSIFNNVKYIIDNSNK